MIVHELIQSFVAGIEHLVEFLYYLRHIDEAYVQILAPIFVDLRV